MGNAKRVVDLFAGCGTFTLPLAEKAEVWALEGEDEMIAALDQGWRQAQGLKKVTAQTRDLFRNPLMPEDLNPFGAPYDAAVIDPPRAGAEAQVAELAQAGTPVIAYVSCNPVTFARDAATLVAAGYVLNWVQVVDQFRWSGHAELVANFTKTPEREPHKDHDEHTQNPAGSERFGRIITAIILLNAVTLGLETSQEVMARFGGVITLIDNLCLSSFCRRNPGEALCLSAEVLPGRLEHL